MVTGVGAQEAAGVYVSNQSEHHRGEYAGERQGYCINTILDTWIFSLSVWGSFLIECLGLENGKTIRNDEAGH